MKYFGLIWAGLWRKKARTILTMLSISIAFLLFGLLQGINQSIKAGFSDNANNRLWTTSRMSAVGSMALGDMTQMQTVKGVLKIAHLTFFGGYFQDSKNAISAFAINPAEFAAVYPELNISNAEVEAMRTTRAGVLISRYLADKYAWKVGDKIPLGTTIWTKKEGGNNWTFDVVGIFDPTPAYSNNPLGRGFWINYDYFDEARAFDLHRVHQYLVQIDDPNQAAAISAKIDKLFENSAEETKSQPENVALQAQLKQLADIDFIANSIVGAVMFTLLFLTANTMMQSVRERIPELAVLKTLGFSGGLVSILVLIESMLLCVLAAVTGLVLGALSMKVVGAALGATRLPGEVVVAGIIIAVGLAIISGLPPAIRAQRLNIVDALAGR